MHIGIIGGGSIGLLVASHLALGGHHITVYVRREAQKEKLEKDGLTMLPNNSNLSIDSLLIGEIKKEDVMIVCVKQYHLLDIDEYIRTIQCPLVFIQNGMGHIDLLKNYPAHYHIIVGTTDHGAMRIDDSTVRHTGKGHVSLALLQGDNQLLDKLADQWNTDHFPVRLKADWYVMLAEKLVVNATINPVTALFQVDNGSILSNKYLYELSKAIFAEAIQVLGLNSEEMWEKVLSVIDRTEHNHSSMKLDISEQRKTEIEGILGYLLENTKSEIPSILFVYRSIKALENL